MTILKLTTIVTKEYISLGIVVNGFVTRRIGDNSNLNQTEVMNLKKALEKHFMLEPRGPNQKMDAFRCKYCTIIYAYHTTRMSHHLVECKGCPDAVKKSIQEKMKEPMTRSNSKRRKSVNVEIASTASSKHSSSNHDSEHDNHSPNKKLKVQQISGFLDSISANDQKQAEEKLAKAIYTSGTPLAIVDNDEWLSFISFMRPTFKVPSRDDISNRLLDKVYYDVKSEVNKRITEANVIGVQCDGFSNIRNEGIYNIVLTTPNPVLLRSIETGTNSQDAQYIADIISDAIEEVGATKVLSVCTDNAAVCKKAWSILEKKYKNHFITCYGCVAHILNLFTKDILSQPSADDIMKSATCISKEIKYSHVLSAKFSEIQNQVKNEKKVTTSLKIPGKTRWGSSLSCLQALYENKYNLKQLAISEKSDKLKSLSINLILSQEFWMKVNKLICLLKPIIAWLIRTENDESRISQIPTVFFELENHIKNDFEGSLSCLAFKEIENILQLVKERKSMALKPIHFAANILDPAFRGRDLHQEEFADGSEIILELHSKFGVNKDDLIIELSEYNSESGIYAKQYIKESVNLLTPLVWWKGTMKHSALGKIATAILSLPCTSAATERSFSTYSWIHCSKRNRLSNARAAKIVYISHNNKLLSNKKIPKKKLTNYFDQNDSDADDSENEKDDMSSNGKENLVYEESSYVSTADAECEGFLYLDEAQLITIPVENHLADISNIVILNPH